VTADLTALPDGSTAMDQIIRDWAPYVAPSNRPVLHLSTLDTSSMNFFMNLRGAGMTAPLGQASDRGFQLTWIAPDPTIYDATARSIVFGETGNSHSWPAHAVTGQTVGDLPQVNCKVRLNGPFACPTSNPLSLQVVGHDGTIYGQMDYVNGSPAYSAGQWFEIDSTARTILDYTGADLSTYFDWSTFIWPVMPRAQLVGVTSYSAAFQLGTHGWASADTSNTEAILSWYDGYSQI
jgi:hypothetical protein